MPDELDVEQVAETLLGGLGVLVRRVRQLPGDGELSLPQRSALGRLDRSGPATSAELARQEQISPQSMGVTIAGLVERGLIVRAPDPDDGRRIVLSVTPNGRALLRRKRSARAAQVGTALSSGFTQTELRQLAATGPLLERLAHRL